ncbi:phage baseplate assembly protein V [Escherichia coli]|nr:phage baseplate assembly protein V [Escherichia coli]ELD0627309.1 phage baseplate assembly protein V [Escherichia coli]
MNAQLTEIMRLITNLIRSGVVTEVDRANWLCRVKTGDLETNWITQGGGAMSSNGIVVDAHQHTGVLKGGDTTGGPV